MRVKRMRAGVGCALVLIALLAALGARAAVAQGVASFSVAGEAIALPLDGLRGDSERGRLLAFDPERGNCTICHPVPGGDARGQGTIGPSLAGVGKRLGIGQLRLRVVDGTQINPATIMPPYHRVDGLNKVGAQWRGKPVLAAQEVEDIVAFLSTLKE
jgi:L-cysteine S-thiosulfotransferase